MLRFEPCTSKSKKYEEIIVLDLQLSQTTSMKNLICSWFVQSKTKILLLLEKILIFLKWATWMRHQILKRVLLIQKQIIILPNLLFCKGQNNFFGNWIDVSTKMIYLLLLYPTYWLFGRQKKFKVNKSLKPRPQKPVSVTF